MRIGMKIGELIDVLEIARERFGGDAEIEFSIEGQTYCREIHLDNISHGEIVREIQFTFTEEGEEDGEEVPEEASRH